MRCKNCNRPIDHITGYLSTGEGTYCCNPGCIELALTRMRELLTTFEKRFTDGRALQQTDRRG